MKFSNDLGCITQLGSQHPGGLVISTLITGPADKVKEVAQSSTAVNFGIENLGYLVFGLTINNDRCQGEGGLDLVRNGVQEARFQHGNMEDQMDHSHRVRQTQYDRMHTCSADDFKRTEILFSKLLSGAGCAEELSLNEGR